MLISIVMPVYNAEAFLEKSVGSIIAQTYKNWELILVDDCSKDNSGELCDKYARSDERIRVIHRTENQGVGQSRNVGISEAKGDYIGFVDADDFIHPQMLEVFYQAICREATDIIMCNATQWPDDRSIEIYSIRPDEINYTQLSSFKSIKTILSSEKDAWKCMIMCNKIYRTNLAKQILLPYGIADDIAFNFTAFRKAGNLLYAESEPLYYWIQQKTSVTHSRFSFIHAITLQTYFDIAKEAFESYYEVFQYAAIRTYRKILSLRCDSKNTPYYDMVMRIIRENFTQFNKQFMKCKDISMKEKLIMNLFYYIPGLYTMFRYWQEQKALHRKKNE